MNHGQPTNPIQELPSRRVGDFLRFHVSWNYWLRRILAVIRQIVCLVECHGETVTTEALATTTLKVIRPPDALARKTEVFNVGSAPATIYEDKTLITVIQPSQRFTMPLSGSLVIEAQAQTETVAVQVVTHRRCLCGDSLPSYGENPEPIGGDLI